MLNGLIFMIFPAWLLAILPQLAGGFIQGIASQGAVNRMNKYNDPRSQLARLNAAGLPMAAMTGSIANTQSALPETGGLGEAISNFQINRIQQKQGELLDEKIREASAFADIAEFDRDIKREEQNAALNEGEVEDGIAYSNAFLSKRRKYQLEKQQVWLGNNEQEIKKIDLAIKNADFKSGRTRDKTIAELDRLILSNNLARQAWHDNNMRTMARDKILKQMEKNGLSLGEALLIQLMNTLSGGIKVGSAQLGF